MHVKQKPEAPPSIPHRPSNLQRKVFVTDTNFAVNPNKGRGARPSTSGFVGVSLHKPTGRWMAYVTLANGKRKNLKRHATAAEAADARAAFIAEHGTAAPQPMAATVTGEVAIA